MYQFCNEDTNKFVLLLIKGVYLYECIDSWKRLNETSLSDKKAFTANFVQNTLLIKTTHMLKKYLKNLT